MRRGAGPAREEGGTRLARAWHEHGTNMARTWHTKHAWPARARHTEDTWPARAWHTKNTWMTRGRASKDLRPGPSRGQGWGGGQDTFGTRFFLTHSGRLTATALRTYERARNSKTPKFRARCFFRKVLKLGSGRVLLANFRRITTVTVLLRTEHKKRIKVKSH